MRKYTPKDDVQKKSYFTDRFYVTPSLAKEEVSNDTQFFEDLNVLKSKFDILDSYIEAGHLVLYIKPTSNTDVLTCLRDDLEYDMLMELSAIDYIKDRKGFEIFYELLSMSKHKRLRLKCFIQEEEELLSVINVFRMANWSEREMYDMYGIKIINHPFMKRILMPDDWYDFPLRKTYPLTGDEAASWYEVDKIFGKEARDTIGPENRDCAAIDRYDTTRFSRLGHEVEYGAQIDENNETKTSISYQEEKKPRFIKEFKKENSKTLKERR